MSQQKNCKKRAVVVTTEYRAVIFGFTSDPSDSVTVTLNDFRNCIYWTKSVGGVFGLAEVGPQEGCTIGMPVQGPITLQKVTSMTDVSVPAVNAWKTFKAVS